MFKGYSNSKQIRNKEKVGVLGLKGGIMLNPNLEKKNEERLIMEEKVFASAAATTPFESTDDVVLSGSLLGIAKGSSELRPKPRFVISQREDSFSFIEKQLLSAQKELTKFPNNPLVLNNLGLTYLSNSETDKAIETFKQALAIKPELVFIALNLASTYSLNNQDDLALKIYNELRTHFPDDSRVLVNIANIHFKNKRLLEAKEIYKQILKNNTKNITARNRLALINLIEGDYNSTISELRKCLSFNVNLPAIYNNLGIAYGVKGFYGKARESFSIALKLSPNYENAVHNLAEILKTSNNILEAIEILEKYLEVNDNSRTKDLLARCYLESRQYQKSLRVLLSLLKIAEKLDKNKENIGRLRNNIGVVYQSMGDFENAESNYFVCIKTAGYNNDVILSNVIELYLNLHKIKDAKKYIDILHDKFGVNNLYFYYSSLYSFNNNQLLESVKEMHEFIKINNKFTPAYSFLSFIYSECRKDYKKAIELNKAAKKYLPNEIGIINNLAYNYLMNNEINEAKELLEKIRHVTSNLFVIATTGLLRMKEGNIEEGERLYDLAASMAMGKILRKQIIQKKHIELAKYYLARSDNENARLNLNTALLINIKNNIYTEQAKELSRNLS